MKANRETPLPPFHLRPVLVPAFLSRTQSFRYFGVDVFSGSLHNSTGRNRSVSVVLQKAWHHCPAGRPGRSQECKRQCPDVTNLRQCHHNCDSAQASSMSVSGCWVSWRMPVHLSPTAARTLQLGTHPLGRSLRQWSAQGPCPSEWLYFQSFLHSFPLLFLPFSSSFPLSIPLFSATFRPTSSPKILRHIVSTWSHIACVPSARGWPLPPHPT